MFDFDFQVTDYGVIGTLPDGEQMEFASEAEYRQAYEENENELYDEMADAFGWDRIPDYAEY